MLTIYRRHQRRCEHRKDGRKYRRCRCPIWVDGFIAGREVRKSLDTVDWQKAQDKVRKWESQEVEPTPAPEPFALQSAGERFLIGMVTRKLKESTIAKYRL